MMKLCALILFALCAVTCARRLRSSDSHPLQQYTSASRRLQGICFKQTDEQWPQKIEEEIHEKSQVQERLLEDALAPAKASDARVTAKYMEQRLAEAQREGVLLEPRYEDLGAIVKYIAAVKDYESEGTQPLEKGSVEIELQKSQRKSYELTQPHDQSIPQLSLHQSHY